MWCGRPGRTPGCRLGLAVLQHRGAHRLRPCDVPGRRGAACLLPCRNRRGPPRPVVGEQLACSRGVAGTTIRDERRVTTGRRQAPPLRGHSSVRLRLLHQQRLEPTRGSACGSPRRAPVSAYVGWKTAPTRPPRFPAAEAACLPLRLSRAVITAGPDLAPTACRPGPAAASAMSTPAETRAQLGDLLVWNGKVRQRARHDPRPQRGNVSEAWRLHRRRMAPVLRPDSWRHSRLCLAHKQRLEPTRGSAALYDNRGSRVHSVWRRHAQRQFSPRQPISAAAGLRAEAAVLLDGTSTAWRESEVKIADCLPLMTKQYGACQRE